MKKSLVVALHIGFWGCYFILILIMLGVYYRTILNAANPQYRVMNAFNSIFLFAFVPSFISYWLYYLFLFPRYLQQRKILLAIVFGILISAAAAVTGYILLRYFIESGRMMDMDEGGKHGRSTAGRTILVMTFIGSVCGGVAMVIKGFITWYNEIKLKELLTAKTHAMEMALVKAQLDPHLLFNTINNIDALILRDPVEASDYLNKLSDMMRFVLYETKAEKILLSQEIEYIGRYIALQKIRTSNRNYVHFEVTGSVGNKLIAPMVFIPFIENAFKHTNNKKLENAITVLIDIREETIRLICRNRYDSKSAKQPGRDGGLGNALVQKRLELIYKGRHMLHVDNQEELYSVNLTIPNE
jgi:two-component system, LytTR family, sensor kinase